MLEAADSVWVIYQPLQMHSASPMLASLHRLSSIKVVQRLVITLDMAKTSRNAREFINLSLWMIHQPGNAFRLPPLQELHRLSCIWASRRSASTSLHQHQSLFHQTSSVQNSFIRFDPFKLNKKLSIASNKLTWSENCLSDSESNSIIFHALITAASSLLIGQKLHSSKD